MMTMLMSACSTPSDTSAVGKPMASSSTSMPSSAPTQSAMISSESASVTAKTSPTTPSRPAVSPPPKPAPIRTPTLTPAPTPISTPPYEAPYVSDIQADGPCWRSTGHTYLADFTITLSGGQGWRIRPQSGQTVLPGGTSFTYRYGVIFATWPPAPEGLANGKVRVIYPLSDDGVQLVTLADGSVQGIVVPRDLAATAYCDL